MKTAFIYLVLIAVGYGVGIYAKKFYAEYKEEERIIEELGPIEDPVVLTPEQETEYRRAHNAAIQLTKEHQLSAALNSIEKMLEIAPHELEPHVLYAETSLELMRWARGVEIVSSDMANIKVIENHVQKANYINPEDYEVLKLNVHYQDWLGLVSRHLGNEEEAMRYFDSAFDFLTQATQLWGQDQKKFAHLLLEKINLLRHMNRLDEALEKLDVALENQELQFMLGQLHFNKALIYAEKKEEKLAESSFQVALQSEGAPFPLIYLHRARFYQESGYVALALDDLEKLRKIYPEDELVIKKIAELREQLSAGS